jgi:hypothetical protein
VFYDHAARTPFIYNDKLTSISNLLLEFFQSLPDIPDDNPITGAGILVGYDARHKRLLFGFYFPEQYDIVPFTGASDIPSLEVGDKVMLFGKPFEFKGVNTSEYECSEPPSCPSPAVESLGTLITIDNNDTVATTLVLEVAATSVLLIPAGILSAVQTGALTWELRRVTTVPGVYSITVIPSNACGTGESNTVNLTITEAVEACVPISVVSVLPGTNANVLAGLPGTTYIATIEYNHSDFTLASNNANITFVKSGNFAHIYVGAGQTVGSYSGTITASNACSTVPTVFNVTIVVEIPSGAPVEIAGYLEAGAGCPEIGTGTLDIVYKSGTPPLVNGDIIYQTSGMTTPKYEWARIIEVSTGKLFTVNTSTGVITDASTICIIN